MIRSLLDPILSKRAALLAVIAGASLAAAGFLVAVPARAVTISVGSGVSCTWNDTTMVLTCGPSGPPPSGCSITGPTSGTMGQNITLNSVCTGGGTATRWLWYGGACGGQTTQSCTFTENVTPPVTVRYYVVASNASGTTPPASQTDVTWR